MKRSADGTERPIGPRGRQVGGEREAGAASRPVVGTSLPRVGAIERVTGAQRYTADLRLEHTLHVKLVHLDCARARIVSVDRRAAAEIEPSSAMARKTSIPQSVTRPVDCVIGQSLESLA